MTQCALQMLLVSCEHNGIVSTCAFTVRCAQICGDDLSRVNKKAICEHLAQLQEEDGSFSAVVAEHAAACGERDIRFMYCAAVISFILDDW